MSVTTPAADQAGHSRESRTRGIVQVGYGSWGASWVAKIAESLRFELRALVELDDGTRARAVEDGVPASVCFATLADALAAAGEAELALIVTPPASHRAVALEALAKGLDCLIEKPLADSLEGAREIVAAADRAGRCVAVSQNYRFKRAPRTVKRVLAAGVIGRVEQVRITYAKNAPFADFRTQMEEPVILDMAVHHLDQLRGIVGLEPARLRARSWNPSWSRFRGNASALIEMETLDGAHVVYTGSWCSNGLETTWDGSWDIQGTRGGIVWANNRVEVRFASVFDTVFLPGALERDGVMDVSLDDVVVEERLGVLAELAAAMDAGRPPETDGHDNLRSLGLVLGALESARAGGTMIELDAAMERS